MQSVHFNIKWKNNLLLFRVKLAVKCMLQLLAWFSSLYFVPWERSSHKYICNRVSQKNLQHSILSLHSLWKYQSVLFLYQLSLHWCSALVNLALSLCFQHDSSILVTDYYSINLVFFLLNSVTIADVILSSL